MLPAYIYTYLPIFGVNFSRSTHRF